MAGSRRFIDAPLGDRRRWFFEGRGRWAGVPHAERESPRLPVACAPTLEQPPTAAISLGEWLGAFSLLHLYQLVFAWLGLDQPHLLLLLQATQTVRHGARGAFDRFADRARRVGRVLLVLAHVAEDEPVQLAGAEAPVFGLCGRRFGRFAGTLFPRQGEDVGQLAAAVSPAGLALDRQTGEIFTGAGAADLHR